MAAPLLGILSNDKAVFGVVVGVPVAVGVLAIIWLQPRRRAPLWGLVTILVLGLVGLDAWTAFRGSSVEASAAAPPPSCSPSGAVLHVTAKGIRFDTSCLAAPANTAFTIAFSNQDPGTGHSIHILTADPAKDSGARTLFQGQVITGPADATYQVGPLPSGAYYFHCDVHPTLMNGAFDVN
jgi:plastocyanin